MSIIIYIATAMGLYVAVYGDDRWKVIRHVLPNQSLTSVAVSENILLAGHEDGLWRSVDDGLTWQPISTSFSIGHVRWITGGGANKTIFLVGTEPAGIFVSQDKGKHWSLSTDVTQMRERYGWFLPYSPEAGCVRSFSQVDLGGLQFRIYAAVEVGGVLTSENLGWSWALVLGSDGKPDFNRELGTMIHPDVHSISVHPIKSDAVTAATGGGLYRSFDGGGTWKNIYPCYIRAVWVDPEDHYHMIAGPADGVSRNGRIEVTTDGGNTWKSAFKGLKAPWPRHMVERFVQAGDELIAVLSNGELWSSRLNRLAWQHVLPQVPAVRAVAVQTR